MLISSAIPNLVNGVSQQPAPLRLASQCEAQENFQSSVVEGLKRRPASRHLAKLTSSSWSTAFLHTINRDLIERYQMVIDGGDLKVFDIFTGNPVTVSFPDGKGYLSASSRDDYRAITVADHTFIVNQKVDVAMSNATTASPNPRALVHVKGGNYSKTFKVKINNSSYSFTTPDGSTASHLAQVATDYIANQLATSIDAGLGASWTVTRYENVIEIVNISGNDFTISTSDGFNGAYMKAIKGSVQRFSDLPGHAPNGFTLEVTGEASSHFDNYYVKWEAATNGETVGTWAETVKSGIKYTLDATTMPHILVRNANGTFTFKQADWSDRTVGDELSAPEPSFVGRPIRDVFFFRNRLGFTAGESVIMSGAGDYYRFWPRTVTTSLDSDPIDIGVSHVKVSTLNHAVPFNQSLLLFSDQTQFVLSGSELLTPSTVSIPQATEFEGSGRVRPVGSGPHIYFPVRRGSFSGVREYYVDGDTRTNNANDVTSHCPKYIPGDVFKLVSSSNEDLIAVLAESAPNAVFIYRYYFSDGQKLQSSWSKWTFRVTDTVLHVALVESSMYLIIQRPDGVFLEEIDLESGSTDANSDQSYRVDRKVYESDLTAPVFDGTYTTWTLPYDEDAPLWVFIRAGDVSKPEGYVLNHTRPASNTVQVKGDWTASKVCIGVRYESRYEFSELQIKEEAAGGGQTSVSSGRLQLLNLSIDYDRAGFFSVQVTPPARSPYEYKFTGRIVGAQNNVLGQSGLETGRFRVPLKSKNKGLKIQITSDHFLPCSFLSAEWEGRFTTRSSRL